MLLVLALFVICVAMASSVAYGSSHDNAPVNIVITTHNPPCTAIFMHDRDGTILQTNLRPLPLFVSYTEAELENGVNVTYSVPAHLAGELLSALSERREVLVAATYSISEPPRLLANFTGSDLLGTSILDITKCGSRLDGVLYHAAYDVVLRGSGPVAASGPMAYDATVWAHISTGDSNAEALAFMRERGIMIQSVSESTPTRVGGITAHVPISLLGKLSEVDHVEYIEEVPLIRPSHGSGGVHTQPPS